MSYTTYVMCEHAVAKTLERGSARTTICYTSYDPGEVKKKLITSLIRRIYRLSPTAVSHTDTVGPAGPRGSVLNIQYIFGGVAE